MPTTVKHNQGSAGGYLQGRKHTQGGIKAINKSTGQPLEMEGGEVVITARAVQDNSKKHEFNGQMLTNRQILSRINESGGGVSFEKGGKIPGKIKYKKGLTYKVGGQVMDAEQVVKHCGCEHEKMEKGGKLKNLPRVGDSVETGYGYGARITKVKKEPNGKTIVIWHYASGLQGWCNIEDLKLANSDGKIIPDKEWELESNHNYWHYTKGRYAEGGSVSDALQEAIKLLRAKKDLGALYESMLKVDPEGLVKMIAQQAQGIGETGKRTEKYDVAKNSAEMAFGRKIVDLSIQAFPAGKMQEGGEINAPLGFNEFKSKYHRIYHYRNEGTREWQLSIHSERFPGYHTFYSRKENPDDAYKDIYEAYKIWVSKGSKMEKGGTMRKKINLPAGINNDEPHNSLQYQHYKHGGKIMANGGAVEYDETESLLREFEHKRNSASHFGEQKWVNRIPAKGKVTDQSLSFIPAEGIESNRYSNQLIYGWGYKLTNDQKRFVIRGLMDGKLKIVEKGDKYILLHKDSKTMARGGETGSDEDTLMSKVDFIRLLKKLEPFVPPMQIRALADIYNGGEESEFAVEKAKELAGYFEKMPKTYGTEKQKEDDKIVYLHYFYGGSDWYIVEKDKLPEQQQAFGYAILNGDYEMSEWGYISLEEILSVRKIELDFYFTPKRFGEVKKKWEGEDEAGNQKSNEVDLEGIANKEAQKQLDQISHYDEKSVIASLTPAQKRKYDSQEEINYHSENALLLAEATGKADLIEAARVLLRERSIMDGLTSTLRDLQYRIYAIIKIGDSTEKAIREVATDMGFKPSQVIIAKVSPPAATITPAQQTSTNEKIRALVKAKGADRKKYSAQELSLLKLYEGAGAEKKTSTDVRILDQFFTPMDIVARMWGMALKHGFNFNKTSVLEPSVGSGRFLQYIPLPSPQVIVSVTAYDVDETCATICKVLFPYFKIVHGSFESLFFRGNTHIGLAGVTQFYDLVIGNPPYRDYVSPYAPLGEKANTGATTFEMYFIARGVDVLKKGGLLIYIIPNTFMSNGSKYNEFKEKLAKKCDLVDAYRLPNGVFGNTDIGTDIICLRKK